MNVLYFNPYCVAILKCNRCAKIFRFVSSFFFVVAVYMVCVRICAQLGPKMAEVILDWFDEGLNVDTFHLVGHSLGGQMCGVIGRSVYKKTRRETQVLRISALDPAFPGFYPSLGTPAVNKNDARFVDIIHTDAWLYGIPIATGHADFWPNSGKSLQPGCPRRGMLLTLSDVGKVTFLLYFDYTQ